MNDSLQRHVRHIGAMVGWWLVLLALVICLVALQYSRLTLPDPRLILPHHTFSVQIAGDGHEDCVNRVI